MWKTKEGWYKYKQIDDISVLAVRITGKGKGKKTNI